MSRVLITGGTGFIGSHLVPFLEGQGYEVHRLVRRAPTDGMGTRDHQASLLDPLGVAKIFARVQPNYLIHLAARGRPGRDLGEFELQTTETVLPSIALARAAPTSLKLALFFGSCEEYGDSPAPFREHQEPRPFSPYGWAKIAAFHGSTLVARQRGLPYCWARPFLTFGPGQNSDQLVPSLIQGCIEGRAIPLSPGEQTRDLIYVTDLCRMVAAILARPDRANGEAINLCSGEPRTVRDVAETIQRLAGQGTLQFGALPYRVQEAMTFYGSLEKYRQRFGEPSLTPFETAIAETISAFRRARGTARAA